MMRVIRLLTILVVILAVAFCGVVGLFLQTVFALTRETPVAEVIMSPIQTDANGEFIEIEYRQYDNPSALEAVINRDASSIVQGETQTLKIYGDVVAVRGPLIKLHPFWQVLGYQNVYKLNLIEGEYRRPNAIENGDGTEIEINGGFNPAFWNFNSNEASPPYNLVIDRFTFSGDEEPGFFGSGRKRYEIVVTMDTITWNFIENVP